MSVNELTQQAELKAKVEYIGREVEQLAAVVMPSVEEIKGQLSTLKTQVHEFLVPEIARENDELKRVVAGLRKELSQCLADLKHFEVAHASEFAKRRHRELENAISKL